MVGEPGWDSHSYAPANGIARILDTSGREVAVLKPIEYILEAWWSPDGSRVLTFAGRHSIDLIDDDVIPEPNRIWDAATGHLIATFTEELNGTVTWSPDGTKIAMHGGIQDQGSPDGVKNVARVFDASTGAVLWSVSDAGTTGSGLAWTPDGVYVLLTRENTICVCDAANGAEVRCLVGHTGSPRSPSVSPDGSRVVTAGREGVARVWDFRSGAEVLTLKCPHHTLLTPAEWSADGTGS